MAEFGTSVVDGKLPMELGCKRVTRHKPSANGMAEEVARSKALAETLTFEHTKLNFGHVEPTAVDGREVEDEAID